MSEEGEGYCALSGELIVAALDGLLEQAVENGDVVRKIESLDVLCAIAGIASYGQEPGWDVSATRLVDVLIAGMESPRHERRRSRQRSGRGRSSRQ